MIKFKIDYNETSENPELIFEFNTASTDLPEKMIRRFLELAQSASLKVSAEKTDKGNGRTELRFFTENI